MGRVTLERPLEWAPTHLRGSGQLTHCRERAEPRGHSVLPRSPFLFLCHFGLHRHWRREDFFPIWFQEAGARLLFSRSKAETVSIRVRSRKPTLRGFVCAGRRAGPPHRYHPFWPSPYTLPSSPGPQSGSTVTQGRSWEYQAVCQPHSSGYLQSLLVCQAHPPPPGSPPCLLPPTGSHNTASARLSSRQNHCLFVPGETLQ